MHPNWKPLHPLCSRSGYGPDWIRSLNISNQVVSPQPSSVTFLILSSQSGGWTVRGSNPGGGEISRTRPDRPWGPPRLLYNGCRVSFPGVKRPGRGVDHPPSYSAEVKERVEQYLYPPSGPSWPVLGRTLLYLSKWPLYRQLRRHNS